MMTFSRMLTIGTDIVLGFLLAIIFAVSTKAILISDFLHTGQVVRPQETGTMVICAASAFISALIAWWLQVYSRETGLAARFIYAFVMLVVVFCAVGGLLVVLNNIFTYGTDVAATEGFLLDGFFWESISGFYAFAIFLISALNLALIGLFTGAALYIGLLGPKARKATPDLVLRTGA